MSLNDSITDLLLIQHLYHIKIAEECALFNANVIRNGPLTFYYFLYLE